LLPGARPPQRRSEPGTGNGEEGGGWVGLRATPERDFEPSDERRQGNSESLAEGAQFDHVDSALSTLALAHERLALTQASSDVLLREAGSEPGLAKPCEEELVTP
jgi:hypothetical protein